MTTFGTISHRTLRTEDLLVAFADELERQVQQNGKTGIENQSTVVLIWEAREVIDFESELAAEFVNDLTDALNEYAPPYSYFGANEGDGSDFGFWPSIDSIDMAIFDGEILKLEAGDEIPDDYEGEVVFVTDHGNITLGYTQEGKFIETWAIV